MPTNGRAPALTPRKLLSHDPAFPWLAGFHRASSSVSPEYVGIRFFFYLFSFFFRYNAISFHSWIFVGCAKAWSAQAGLTRLNAEFATKGKIQLVSGILLRDSIWILRKGPFKVPQTSDISRENLGREARERRMRKKYFPLIKVSLIILRQFTTFTKINGKVSFQGPRTDRRNFARRIMRNGRARYVYIGVDNRRCGDYIPAFVRQVWKAGNAIAYQRH